MKVLLVYKFFIPRWGGIETLMYNIAKGLSKYCEVSILTTKLDSTNLKKDYKLNIVSIPRVLLPHELDIVYSVKAISNLIRKNDIIILFGIVPSMLFFLTLLIGKLFKKPLVWIPTYHSNKSSVYSSSFLISIKKFYDGSLVPIYSKLFSALLMLNNEEEDFFKRYSDGKTYVIGECLEEPSFDKTEDRSVLSKYGLSEGKYILSVGRIIWRKGFDLLIEAWGVVCQKFPELKLVIVGRDEGFKQNLISIITRRNIKNVIFTGEVDNESLNILYRNSLAVALTSRSESFHRIALEAWSHKKPIIALDIGGGTEHITPDCGILVQKEDIEEVAKALEYVALNKDKAKLMGENGYKKFKKYYELNSYTRKLIKILSLIKSADCGHVKGK
jgi:glycosyltransferase involved in cell wall biosynthesis